MTTSLPTVTVGIPAHNEAANIGYLLSQIFKQAEDTFTLTKVIIFSDGSTDTTIAQVQEVTDPRLELLISHERRGLAWGLNQIIAQTTTDFLIILNADISIADQNFLQKMINALTRQPAVDLVAAALQPLPTTAWLDRILAVGTLGKQRAFTQYQDSHNLYTCHGPARGFSRRLYQKLYFSYGIADDMYSYLFCQSQGLAYRFVPEAIVEYKLPATWSDHLRQSVRFFKSPQTFVAEFGQTFVAEHTRLPWRQLLKAGVVTWWHHPILASLYVMVTAVTWIWSRFQARTSLEQAWSPATSSKILRP